jgi:hypothetical protein
MSSLAALILVGVSALGQAKAESTKEQFQELGQILVGKWVMESTTDISVEGVCKPGDKFVENTSYEWVSNQVGLVEKRAYQMNAKVVAEGVTLIGWDAPKAQIRSTYFDSLGGSWQSTWRKTRKGFTVQHKGVSGDGKKSASRNTATVSPDGKSITIKVTDRVHGDQQLDDIEVVYQRVQQ